MEPENLQKKYQLGFRISDDSTVITFSINRPPFSCLCILGLQS